MARVSFVARIRATGLAVAWVALFVVVWFAVTFAVSRVIVTPVTSRWNMAGDALCGAVGALAATWLVGARLNKHTWAQMGWHRERWLRGLAGGVGTGVAMAVLAIGIAILVNGAAVRVQPEWGQYLAIVAPLALGLVIAAVFEELLFRGYPLRRLADAIGPWGATAVTALAFSAAHFSNPDVSFLGKVNILLAGIWLAFAFFSPGGMAYAWGLHFGWNAGQALTFDAPVSGFAFGVPAVDYAPGARGWVDGGSFGPEGGAIGTVVLLAGTLVTIGARLRQPQTWLA